MSLPEGYSKERNDAKLKYNWRGYINKKEEWKKTKESILYKLALILCLTIVIAMPILSFFLYEITKEYADNNYFFPLIVLFILSFIIIIMVRDDRKKRVYLDDKKIIYRYKH